MLTKSRSCNELQKRSNMNTASTAIVGSANGTRNFDRSEVEQHKTVIYFGDTIANRRNKRGSQNSSGIVSDLVRNASNKSEDFQHARRLCDEMVFKRQNSIRVPRSKLLAGLNRDNKSGLSSAHALDSSKSSLSLFESDQNLVMKELKSVVEVKLKNQLQKLQKPPIVDKPIVPNKVLALPQKKLPQPMISMRAIDQNVDGHAENVIAKKENEVNKNCLPSFVESIENGVINIRIDGSFGVASKLAESLGHENNSVSDYDDIGGSDMFLDVGNEANNVYFDWSFVQDWRTG